MKKISSKPNWSYEYQQSGLVAGIDEAGRGPLAGPVVASAVILDKTNIPDGLNDSKKLSAAKREVLFEQIYTVAIIGIGIAEPAEIDRLNILGATLAAMTRAVEDLKISPSAALIDGNRIPSLPIPAQTIVKGDQKSLSIAAASIVAKVTRDRLMARAAALYPKYGFATHKGYPTQAHRNALMQYGPCPIHRAHFAPVKRALTSMNKTLKP